MNLQARSVPAETGDAPNRYDTLPAPGGYLGGGALCDPGNEPVGVAEGAIDVLVLRGAGLRPVVAVQPRAGWHWS